jgi:aminobenzoyl-glutamate transport protein
MLPFDQSREWPAEGSMGFFERFLDGVEWLGNRLPHPFILFVYLALLVIFLSWIASLFGASVQDPGTGEEVAVQNLLSGAGVEYILTSMVQNFVEFPPLGLVITILLGIGLAQQVGLISAFMRKIIIGAPRSLVTYAVVFAGIIGSWASDAATIIIPPLAGIVFISMGRHPLAGIALGFAGVSAGFNANLLIAGTDVLLSGISTEAAQSVDEGLTVSPLDNLFFINASVLFLTIVGALVTERIVEPRLGQYRGNGREQDLEEVRPRENRGLRNALIAALAFAAGLVLAVLPSNSPLRGEGGALLDSPLISGIVPILLLFFVTVAIAYGVTVGQIARAGDVPRLMAESAKGMAGLIVLFFAAAQFIAYFEHSNLATWLAVTGADFLERINLTGLPLIIGFIGVVAVLNLFITSGSAQWSLMAPIFVPLFLLLDYNPAYTQLAFRIADSSTNIITPMNVFVPMVLGFMREYDEDAGFGTLFSLMLPYTLFYLLSWTLLFVAWSLLGLPIGPGVYQQAG